MAALSIFLRCRLLPLPPEAWCSLSQVMCSVCMVLNSCWRPHATVELLAVRLVRVQTFSRRTASSGGRCCANSMGFTSVTRGYGDRALADLLFAATLPQTCVRLAKLTFLWRQSWCALGLMPIVGATKRRTVNLPFCIITCILQART